MKPNIITSARKCEKIIEEIRSKNFEVYDLKVKFLTKEEILNLYYKQVDSSYFEDILKSNMQGPSAILILKNKEDTYLDSNNIPTKYKSPVYLWKEFIGPKNPADDKDKKTLRGKYGSNIIDNAFYGSDSPSEAYKDLSCFYFPIPALAPKFKFDKFKISQSTLYRFLFPVVPNHPDVCGRLDLFAKMGPVLDYHVLDLCFCEKCKLFLRNEILTYTNKDLKKDTHKIITDEFLGERIDKLCEICYDHVLHWSHMYSGKEQAHLLTNNEIDIEVENMNREQLLQILISEKGSCAETILSKINIKIPPKEITYELEHIKILLSKMNTDYYDRYDYEELQNLILEDRRVRLNFWVGGIISKPNERFKIPQLVNPLSKKEISDMKSYKYTLLRMKPIVVKNYEEEEFMNLIIMHPIFVKKKLSDFEIKNMIIQLFNKNFYKVATEDTKNDTSMVSNMIMMRNYDLATVKIKKLQNESTMRKLDINIKKTLIDKNSFEQTLNNKKVFIKTKTNY